MTSQASQRPPVRVCKVNKDQRGYGLTVHGTRPVIVQSVRAEGAAWKAGIREMDEILEVNGVPVDGKAHSEVVKLIKEKPCVEFKVTAGNGRRSNGASSRARTTTTKTTVLLAGDRRSADPEHFKEISAISPEAAKHLRASEKSQDGKQTSSGANNDASPRSEARTGLRSSVTSPRPWVAALQHSPTPLLEEPPNEASEFPLTHTKSCSMPEQASASLVAAKPTRSKSDAQKRRPLSMDVASLESSAGATSASPSPSPASSNSNLTTKPHSKSFLNVSFLQKHSSFRSVTKVLNPSSSLKRWVSNPRVDETPSDESTPPSVTQVSATLPPPPKSSVSEEEEVIRGHRRNLSLEMSDSKMQEQDSKNQFLTINDEDDMMNCEEELQLHRQQIGLFADLAKVLDRPDLTVTILHYGHEKANNEEGNLDFHRFLFLLVMLEYRRCVNLKDVCKDHKRIAYEIFSSFLAHQAPLNVGLNDQLASDVSEPFKRDDDETTPSQLRVLLIKAQEETALSLKLLDHYRNEAERGLDTVYTNNFNFINSTKELRLNYFERKMSEVNSAAGKLEDSPRRSAILAALASASRFFQADEKKPYRSTENIAFATVTPFNTTVSKSKSMLFGGSRQKKTTLNSHSLTLKNIESFHICDVCAGIISGTAPQAEVCHHCTAVVHRECRGEWRRICDRDRDRSKRSSMLLTLINKGQPKRESTATIYEGKKRPSTFREGSEPPPATSPNADSRNVESIVSKFNSGDFAEDRELGAGASAPEERLSRSESMKLPGSKHNAAPWSHRSFMDSRASFDSSLHADAIAEAESLSLPPNFSSSSSSEPPDRSPSMSMSITVEYDTPEVAEMDVKKRLEQEPLLQRLPADVQEYFQKFGFRDYYERLGREGSRKGRSYLKDYQTSCCEIYFQELSHLRNLKVMQFMFVEPWPQSAEDLRQAMGLDKICDLIDLRVSLVQELSTTRKEEGGKKFVNMGQGYLNWLTEDTMIRLKCLLGSIRYKGENYFDKLLAERHKRLGSLVERTFNKLNLFDLMISVNQHACRPSLLMAPVKKALSKLVKSDEAQYQPELDTWKKAEARLNEVAHYLDQLKRRVVDVIPKIDATKIRELPDMPEEPNVPALKDVPRCLNSFLFLRDADCQVRKERDGKVREARLLQFADFLVLLYQEAKDGPERFVMRPWEHIMPILPHSRILHVINDRTSKTPNTLLLAIEMANLETSKKSPAMRDSFLYMSFKDKNDMESFKSKLATQRPKLFSSRGPSLGSSASMSEPSRQRVNRSGSTVSAKSAMAGFQHDGADLMRSETISASPPPEDKDSSPELQRQDSGDNKTLRQNSSDSSSHSLEKVDNKPNTLLTALRDMREAIMTRQQLSEPDFEKVADVVETEGAKDSIDLQVVLVAHLTALTEQLSRLSGPAEACGAQEAVDELLHSSQRFQNCLTKYSQNIEQTRHSVFEESMTESQATTSFCATPSDEELETDDASKTPEVETEEETEEDEYDDEEEKQEERVADEAGGEEQQLEEEDGTPVAFSDDEDSAASELRAVASDFVRHVMAQALVRCRLEANACGGPEE